MGITVVQLLRTRLISVRKLSADASMMRHQHKVIYSKRKPTIIMGEFRVGQDTALYDKAKHQLLILKSVSPIDNTASNSTPLEKHP